MAIELHHLNTHGMMESAGKVLDGVARLKERIAELEKENQTLAEEVSDKIESITELMELVEKYKSEKAELEEERRWRKCSEELPEVGVEVLVTNGIDCGISDWCGDYWNNDPFCGYTVCDNVIAWMPLPKAPEVEK